MKELEALLAILHTPYLGPVRAHALLRHFGSPIKLLQADPAEVAALPNFSQRIARSLAGAPQREERWQRDLESAERASVTLIPFWDERYPKPLLQLADHPLLLYVKGELQPTDSHRSIAVIGTRNATLYGREMAARFGRELASYGYTIVSGLARGIDTEVHRAALHLPKGRTLAVIGSGLNKLYPSENQRLVDEIVATGSGAIISEYPMATPPDRQNFPRRNRIVSAVSQFGSLLIEAPMKSGAMITMRLAQKQGRKLFALPGRLDFPTFSGNHTLIKKGEAILVESAADIAASFEDFFTSCPQGVGRSIMTPAASSSFSPSMPSLSPEEQKLWEAMPNDELTIDELVEKTQIPVMKLSVMLMSLVLKKKIREFPGKVYKKNMT